MTESGSSRHDESIERLARWIPDRTTACAWVGVPAHALPPTLTTIVDVWSWLLRGDPAHALSASQLRSRLERIAARLELGPDIDPGAAAELRAQIDGWLAELPIERAPAGFEPLSDVVPKDLPAIPPGPAPPVTWPAPEHTGQFAAPPPGLGPAGGMAPSFGGETVKGRRIGFPLAIVLIAVGLLAFVVVMALEVLR